MCASGQRACAASAHEFTRARAHTHTSECGCTSYNGDTRHRNTTHNIARDRYTCYCHSDTGYDDDYDYYDDAYDDDGDYDYWHDDYY